MTLDRDLVVAALPAYDLGAELGRGGWGVVLQGRHRQLGREVAIKQLPRAFAADPAVRARFVAEARLLAAFDHPHIVPVYDFVDVDGLCLLVMEKLPGGTVWSRFSAEGLSMDTACAIALAACAGLHCAHTKGVLHRDIKPENLLFSSAEVLKVTDFGIAKVVGGSQTLATRAGEVLGTPAYMAPEQAQAKELSPATDVYATGIMLYELLSGQLPFPEDGDALAVVFRHVYEQPAPLADVAPQVPGPICQVVMRAMATDPADRYETAEAFGVALAEAATSAWSPGWLGRGDFPVMSATAIVAATERASGPVGGPQALRTVGVPARPAPETEAQPLPVPVPVPTPAVPTPAVPTPAVPTPAVPTPAVPTPAVPAAPVPTERARPSTVGHRGGGRLGDIDAADLVPVNEVLERPPSPTPMVLAALALVLLSLVVAFAGPGSPGYDRGPGTPPLTVNGAEVGATPVEVDLSEPVVVAGTQGGGPSTIGVALLFSAAGVPLGSGSTTAAAAGDGSFTASLDVSGARYLVPGRATATLVVSDPNGPQLARRSFPVSSAQPSLLSAPGLAGLALLLFVLAYAESLLRSRRRGRKRVTAPVGMVMVGALGGVAATIAAWLFVDREPVVPTVAVSAALGAAAGVVAAVAAARSARRRRLRPRKRA